MPATIPCPACGTENPTDAAQCQVCDYELRLRSAPTSASIKCPRCGSHVPNGAVYCQICGQSVDERLPRPNTGSLNIRAIFGDQSDAPRRMPIRERTELAPAAARPQLQPYVPPEPVRPEIPNDDDSSPVPRGRRRPAPRPRPAYSGFDPADSGLGGRPRAPAPAPTPSPAVSAAKANPSITVYGERSPYADQPARSTAPPRPQAQRASSSPSSPSSSPSSPSSSPSSDPSASMSSGNAPRPRMRHEAHAEPIAPYVQQQQQAPSYGQAPGFGQPGGQPGGGAQPAGSLFGQSYGGAPVHSWAPPGLGGAQAGPAAQLRLVLVGRDGQEGESFPIPAQGAEIGRNAGIAFPSDPFVSPRHAQMTIVDGGVHLVDLGSRNGIYLRLTEPAPVYPGDHFLLGNQLLRLDRLDAVWQESPLDAQQVRGFGTPVKPPWALLVRICVGEIEDDRYHLRGGEMTIGREEGEIVFPSDGFLSRAHARLRMAVQDHSMTVLLEDLGSANGTYLRIRGPVMVPYGGMFRVGDQIFRVRKDS